MNDRIPDLDQLVQRESLKSQGLIPEETVRPTMVNIHQHDEEGNEVVQTVPANVAVVMLLDAIGRKLDDLLRAVADGALGIPVPPAPENGRGSVREIPHPSDIPPEG